MTFKEYRHKYHLKQTELVAIMNEYGVDISQPHLSLIENGKMDPTLEQSAWLAGVTGDSEGFLTTEEEQMLEFLKTASQTYPITRRSLSAWNRSDRENRKTIANLRAKGYWIVENKEGYYITDDPEVFKEWSIRYTAYARTILRTEAAMRKRLMGR